MSEDSCAERDNCRQQPVPIALTEDNRKKARCPSIKEKIEQTQPVDAFCLLHISLPHTYNTP